jgi:sulfoxide reductase catalytic subunit YedY
MLIKSKRGWELPESAATPEAAYLNRRDWLKAMGYGAMLAAGAPAGLALAQGKDGPNPNAGLYPAKRNEKFTLDRPITEEKLATTYNNFYEYGSHKGIWRDAQQLPVRPWRIKFDGLIEKPFEIDADELIAKMPLEERLYRFRCVEAWSMAVPWTGFPIKALLDFAKPLGSAKYLVMQTLNDVSVMPGLREFYYPWPYTDGLTIAEAANDLAIIATGLYGKPMPKQNGAPLRFITPWKYGFKQVKSIATFTFSDKRPVGFWEKVQGSEYGFWANINPAVDHPRWSQATEQLLGSQERIPTLLYNGYGEQVADLYKDLKGERLFA